MKDSGKVFQELRKDIATYLELKLELFKANTYERAGHLLSVLSYILLIIFLIFFIVLFISLALVVWLAELFGSIIAGLAGGVVLYIILIGIAVKNRRLIRTRILNEIIAVFAACDRIKTGQDNGQPTDETTDTAGKASS